MGNKTPPEPKAPDYAAANREGILTDVETLPVRRQIDVAARLGKKVDFELDGKSYSYDFGGVSDADVVKADLETNRFSAFAQAQDLLDIQDQYGLKFLENSRNQLKASDPIGFAMREKLGEQVTDELEFGRAISDDERRTVQQSVRATQVTRNNTDGLGAAVQEVLAQHQYGEQRGQQRKQNAAAFLSGTTPLSQFGQLRSAASGAAPFAAVAANAVGLDRNAGNAAAAFAQQSYGTQAQVYNTQVANQSNPWMEGIGMALGAGTQLGSAALMGPICWVAREVYGAGNPRWLKFREWLDTKATDEFREFYIEHGPAIAEEIKGDEKMKTLLRHMMDSKINELN